MESSRIFIKGLPPTFSDAEFRKHFAQRFELTDAKIFPNRRIGYVGYKTPEDARKAVKYFNKTFIRMSRIGVELARPVPESKTQKHSARDQPVFEKYSDVVRVDGSKQKRDVETTEGGDGSLKQFLAVMKPRSKKRAWETEDVGDNAELKRTTKDDKVPVVDVASEGSDDEYERIPKKQKRSEQSPTQVAHAELQSEDQHNAARSVDDLPTSHVETSPEGLDADNVTAPVSNSDWLRSRINRTLNSADDDREHDRLMNNIDENMHINQRHDMVAADGDEDQEELEQTEHESSTMTQSVVDRDIETVRSTMRLFVRNLPYDVEESALEAEFSRFRNLEEVHVSTDKKSGNAKGFAYVQFSDPDSAIQAIQEMDQQIFQGRLIHILPATEKRGKGLDEFALSKLPLKKQQQIRRRRDAAKSTFNWNALYMNADAVISSVADRLGLSKAEVLDPTSSDAAIMQAHAETHVIQEIKGYFKEHGVDLDSFKHSQRGDTVLLVKNIPYDCSRDELRKLFEEQGEVKRFLMPPTGIIAIVEYSNAAQCKAAFGALAYRKLKSSVLFLEKAPVGVFDAKTIASEVETATPGFAKMASSELKEAVPEGSGSATLFVRNLNFSTTSEIFANAFEPLDGFVSARVKTKTDPKKPGKILSMGFGFVEFLSAKQAQAALQAMDGSALEGHQLQVRASHKGHDAAEERRQVDAAKRVAGKRTKVIIKNLPFQASRQDVRALFGAYGQLRSVRVPKKMDRTARGFAFADFITPKEAQNAIEALKNTHLLGRRLILELAAEDPEDADAEIEKMQQKVGRQVNQVALQKLTSGGRKKFSTQNNEEDDGP